MDVCQFSAHHTPRKPLICYGLRQLAVFAQCPFSANTAGIHADTLRQYHRRTVILPFAELLRFAATSYLVTRRDTIVVASVSCIYGLGSADDRWADGQSQQDACHETGNGVQCQLQKSRGLRCATSPATVCASVGGNL